MFRFEIQSFKTITVDKNIANQICHFDRLHVNKIDGFINRNVQYVGVVY